MRQPTSESKLLVMLTDYMHNIDALFRTNEGLRSRFKVQIEFSSHTPEACVDLAYQMAVKETRARCSSFAVLRLLPLQLQLVVVAVVGQHSTLWRGA